MVETITLSLRDFGENEKRIIAAGLQGYNDPQISQAAGCTEHLVRMVLRRYGERLNRIAKDLEQKNKNDPRTGS
jgi:hypothetical protein